jgi:N-methylhydantoinase A
MPLDPGRSQRALARLGEALGLSAEQAALGVIQVVEAHMERALRVISVERGHDPRRFTLLSFGGAGGLHAAGLARRLGIPLALVPPLASTLSAFGMLAADLARDYSQTVMLPGETPLADLAARLEPLAASGRRDLLAEGVAAADLHLEPAADLRYQGQSYELRVPFSADLLADFHALHQQAYGYQLPAAPVEIVTLRLRAAPAFIEQRLATLVSGPVRLPLYRGEALRPGNCLSGPALVLRADTSILLDCSDQAEVDAWGNLLIRIA